MSYNKDDIEYQREAIVTFDRNDGIFENLNEHVKADTTTTKRRWSNS